MQLEHKNFEQCEIKTAGDQGIVEAIVSTYSVDRAGEKVMPGAFTKTLQNRRNPIPIVLGHDWNTPIGLTLDARETPEGLYVKGQLNLDLQSARDVLSNLRKKVLSQWSIGYRVVKDSVDRKNGIRSLHEIELHEVSAVLVGCNQDTRLLSVKGEKNMSAAEQQLNRPNFGGHPAGYQQPEVTSSVGERFVESKSYRDFIHTNSTGAESAVVTMPEVSLKTLLTSTGYPPESTRSGLLVPYATPAPVITDFIPTITIDQAQYKFMSETVFVNAATEILEGQTKPEAQLAYEEVALPCRKIAVNIPVTDEILEDFSGMSDLINNRLSFMVRQRLSLQILQGDGISPNLLGLLHWPGTQSEAKGANPTPDAIYNAMTKVRNAEAVPSAVVMHPTDWKNVKLLRETSTGNYIWGSPSEAGPDRIWGVPVIQTNQMVQGTAIVADLANYSLLAQRSGGVMTKVGYVGQQFVENKKTFLAEFRCVFILLRPTAACLVTGLPA